MLEKIIKILLCSRVFSSPMTILSWLVIYTVAVIESGNIWYGLLALIGLCCVHFGTNLLDDYFDYKALIKQVNFNKEEYLKNSQKTKCRYLINGFMDENALLLLTSAYFFIAILICIFFYFTCGQEVLIFAVTGAIIAIMYPFASRICLSEVCVGLAYGPALFGGVYYVMCGTILPEIFILSIPTMFMTIVLLYIHTVMDYEYDTNEGKKTLANNFKTPLNSLIVLKILLILAYTSIPVLCICDIGDWQIFLTFLTIPMAIDLFKSMTQFTQNDKSIPTHKWYHFPMENMNNFKLRGEDAFMTRIYQARNLMVYFSILLALGLIFSLGI